MLVVFYRYKLNPININFADNLFFLYVHVINFIKENRKSLVTVIIKNEAFGMYRYVLLFLAYTCVYTIMFAMRRLSLYQRIQRSRHFHGP